MHCSAKKSNNTRTMIAPAAAEWKLERDREKGEREIERERGGGGGEKERERERERGGGGDKDTRQDKPSLIHKQQQQFHCWCPPPLHKKFHRYDIYLLTNSIECVRQFLDFVCLVCAPVISNLHDEQITESDHHMKYRDTWTIIRSKINVWTHTHTHTSTHRNSHTVKSWIKAAACVQFFNFLGVASIQVQFLFEGGLYAMCCACVIL